MAVLKAPGSACPGRPGAWLTLSGRPRCAFTAAGSKPWLVRRWAKMFEVLPPFADFTAGPSVTCTRRAHRRLRTETGRPRHGAATLAAQATQRRYARIAATRGWASLDERGHGTLTSPPRVRSPCANKLVRGCPRVPRGTSGDAQLATMHHARKCFRFPDSIKRRSDCRRRAKNHTGDPVLGVADGQVWKFRAGVLSVASWAASGLG